MILIPGDSTHVHLLGSGTKVAFRAQLLWTWGSVLHSRLVESHLRNSQSLLHHLTVKRSCSHHHHQTTTTTTPAAAASATTQLLPQLPPHRPSPLLLGKATNKISKTVKGQRLTEIYWGMNHISNSSAGPHDQKEDKLERLILVLCLNGRFLPRCCVAYLRHLHRPEKPEKTRPSPKGIFAAPSEQGRAWCSNMRSWHVTNH